VEGEKKGRERRGRDGEVEEGEGERSLLFWGYLGFFVQSWDFCDKFLGFLKIESGEGGERSPDG